MRRCVSAPRLCALHNHRRTTTASLLHADSAPCPLFATRSAVGTGSRRDSLVQEQDLGLLHQLYSQSNTAPLSAADALGARCVVADDCVGAALQAQLLNNLLHYGQVAKHMALRKQDGTYAWTKQQQ